MNRRTLALATFAALFGAGASFAQTLPGDEKPADPVDTVSTPVPQSGATIASDDPAVSADEIDDARIVADDFDDDDADVAATDVDPPPPVADAEDAMDDPTETIDDAALASDTATTQAAAATATTSGTTAQSTSPPERTGAQERGAQADVARMDADGSGTLAAGEVDGLPKLAARFDDYDSDDSGDLSVDEYQSWLGSESTRDRAEADAARVVTTLDDDAVPDADASDAVEDVEVDASPTLDDASADDDAGARDE